LPKMKKSLKPDIFHFGQIFRIYLRLVSLIARLLTHAGVRRPSLSGSMAGGFPG